MPRSSIAQNHRPKSSVSHRLADGHAVTGSSAKKSVIHAEQLLGPAVRNTKTSHHLVADQERSVLPRKLAQRLQKLPARNHDPHIADDRLEDHAGNARAMFGERFPQTANVVVLKN